MDFDNEYQEIVREVNRCLQHYVTVGYPNHIYEAMRYSLLAGGKRARPALLLGAYNAVGGVSIEDAYPFACAIEMIHTYSLIHDDLPCMDDDDLRRGRPTSHKVFGEATALLAGDGLLNLAYETMLDANARHGINAMRTIAYAAGIRGMIGGQVMDILSEGEQIDKTILEYIHKNKTAALIGASLKAGAILAGADDTVAERFYDGGQALGLAFQIKDDCLDYTSTTEQLGKSASDSRNNKTTFVTIYGLEASLQMVSELTASAIGSFSISDGAGDFLVWFAKFLMDRNY